MNSSYVLIENASFCSRLGNGGIYTLSVHLVSILYCHGATKLKVVGLKRELICLTLVLPTGKSLSGHNKFLYLF